MIQEIKTRYRGEKAEADAHVLNMKVFTKFEQLRETFYKNLKTA